MLPVIAIVGRPNVGKSTLFNRLTHTRDALVDDEPGITRDRMYGLASFRGGRYLLVDTGGLSGEDSVLGDEIRQQADLALEEASAVILLVDARNGSLRGDREIAEQLRQASQSVFLVVNKAEGMEREYAASDFHELGLGKPYPVSAKTGSGLALLADVICAQLPSRMEELEEARPRLAVIGRPNVGKSTLVNAFLGSQRMIVADLPGTTRDSVKVPLDRQGQRFLLSDTAGVRRKSKVRGSVEKYSIVKTLQAIADSSVSILVLDGQQGIIEQDKSISGLVIQNGCSIVVVVNKWDRLEFDKKQRIEQDLVRHFSFLPTHETIYVSALHGTGIEKVLNAAGRAHRSSMKKLPTNQINQLLAEAIEQHPPARQGGRSIKLKYAHQGGRNPPTVVIHGNMVDRLTPEYRRYLAGYFSKAFKLIGAPVKIETRTSKNPYT